MGMISHSGSKIGKKKKRTPEQAAKIKEYGKNIGVPQKNEEGKVIKHTKTRLQEKYPNLEAEQRASDQAEIRINKEGRERDRATKQAQIDLAHKTRKDVEARDKEFQKTIPTGSKISQGIMKAGETLKGIPGVGSALKLGGKTATKALGATGLISPEAEQITKEWWGGNVTVKDVAGTVGLFAATGIATQLVGNYVAASATAPNIMKGIFLKKATPAISKVGPGALKGVTTARAQANMGIFANKSLVNKTATATSNMNRNQLGALIRSELSYIKNNPGKAIFAGSLMTVWFGADNLLTTASMGSQGVADDVRFGNITPEEGLEILDQADADINRARGAYAIGAINPITYKIIHSAEAQSISLKKRNELQRTRIRRGT